MNRDGSFSVDKEIHPTLSIPVQLRLYFKGENLAGLCSLVPCGGGSLSFCASVNRYVFWIKALIYPENSLLTWLIRQTLSKDPMCV